MLGSGKGSNYQAIQEAINSGGLAAETRMVLSDVEDSGILKLARDYGMSAMHVPPGKFKTKLEPEIEEQIAQLLKYKGVELVVLAGYMPTDAEKAASLRCLSPGEIYQHPSRRSRRNSPASRHGNRRWPRAKA